MFIIILTFDIIPYIDYAPIYLLGLFIRKNDGIMINYSFNLQYRRTVLVEKINSY